jgi:toxin ParE1/3/4
MPQRYRRILLPEAAANIAEIHDYISKDAPQNAALVVRRFMDAIDSLDLFPHRCKIHASNKNPDRVVRSLPVSSFIIYFRILEKDQTVEVMTIRRGSRRQPRRFKF